MKYIEKYAIKICKKTEEIYLFSYHLDSPYLIDKNEKIICELRINGKDYDYELKQRRSK